MYKKGPQETMDSKVNSNPVIGLLEEVNLASAQETKKPVTNSSNVTPETDVNYRVLVNPSSDCLEEIPYLKKRKEKFETKKHTKERLKEYSLKV